MKAQRSKSFWSSLKTLSHKFLLGLCNTVMVFESFPDNSSGGSPKLQKVSRKPIERLVSVVYL